MLYSVNLIHLNGTERPIKLARTIQVLAGNDAAFREDAAQSGIAAANPYSEDGLAAVAELVHHHGTREAKALFKRLNKAGY
ncbi:MAG: hypothetical protein KGJ13_08965 [Patescibacteria group bacterium]|nr:hypothetical protein [Patescibacteria group bacterium]